MQPWFGRAFFFLIFCLEVVHAQAKNPPDTLRLDTLSKRIALTDHIQLWADSSGQLTFSEVRETLSERPFVPAENIKPRADIVYWGRLVLESRLRETTRWRMLLFGDYVTAYVEDPDGSFAIKKTGGMRPGSELDIPEEWFHIQVPLKPGQVSAVYFRLENLTHTNMSIRSRLEYEPDRIERLHQLIARRNLTQGLFHGMIWIMVIYNLLIFASVRDRAFLFYALYLMSASLYFLSRFRFLLESVFYEHPQWSIYSWALGVGAISICYHLFLRAFFETKRRLPRLDRLIQLWVYVKMVLTGATLLWLNLHMNLQQVVSWSVVPLFAELVISTYVLAQIIIRLRKTDIKSVRYFMVGTGFLLLGLMLYAFYFLGFRLDLFDWSGNMLLTLEGSILLEIVFFSLGLGHKMRQDKSARLEAQAELILQLKKNEKLQKQHTQNLERKVKERTAEIRKKNNELGRRNEEVSAQRDELEKQKTQIEAQNQKLVELNEEKNHLIGIVAHDLRNPLSSILTVADLMKSDQENLSPDDQQECVEHIHNTLNRMNQMITRILDVRAIEGEHLQLYPEKLEVAEVLQEVLAEFEERAHKKGIRISAELKNGIFASLDRAYTLQIFENLVSNALKFSPPETEVCLCLKNEGEKVRAEVRDQGPGIPEEEQPKLFQKYKKLSNRPTNGETSTGLGLSIVKKYVEAMEGSVWCESQPGQGATFVVEFRAIS